MPFYVKNPENKPSKGSFAAGLVFLLYHFLTKHAASAVFCLKFQEYILFYNSLLGCFIGNHQQWKDFKPHCQYLELVIIKIMMWMKMSLLLVHLHVYQKSLSNIQQKSQVVKSWLISSLLFCPAKRLCNDSTTWDSIHKIRKI